MSPTLFFKKKKRSLKSTLPFLFCSCEACWDGTPQCQQVGSVVTHWQQKPVGGFQDWPSKHVTESEPQQRVILFPRWLHATDHTLLKKKTCFIIGENTDYVRCYRTAALCGACCTSCILQTKRGVRVLWTLWYLVTATRGQCCISKGGGKVTLAKVRLLTCSSV